MGGSWPANRDRAQVCLISIAGVQADGQRAALAALMSADANPAKTVKQAEETFRLVQFSSLRGKEELPGSGSEPSDPRALRALAIGYEMGQERSVFVSHR